MMTDAMKPMGISVFQEILPYGKNSEFSLNSLMVEAGGRLFLTLLFFCIINFFVDFLSGELRFWMN